MTDVARISADRIYDGINEQPFSGHILIRNGAIHQVIPGPSAIDTDHRGELTDIPELLDVPTGAVVLPGFVDMHSHSDWSLLAHPDSPSKLAQGVTTEVVGNCGFSTFPASDYWLEPTDKYGLDRTGFLSLRAYWDALSRRSTASNVATLIGLGAVRTAVMDGNDGVPHDHQIRAMAFLVAEALEQGALGISMGMFYRPGCFASVDEVVSIMTYPEVKAVCPFFAVHLRDESVGLLASLNEAFDIARRTGMHLHIAHLKAKGRGRGTIGLAIEQIERSQLDVTVDVYPYEASMTRIDTLIPPSAMGANGEPARNSPKGVVPPDAVRDFVLAREGDEAWDRIVIANAPGRRELVGQTLRAAAERLGIDPAEVVLEVAIATNGRAEIINHCLATSDVEMAVRLPYAAIASDGYAMPLDAYGSLPHPRSFGTFPRFLSQYGSAGHGLGLGWAIRKTTSLPAQISGLKPVGRLVNGAMADIAVIDPDRFRDLGDYAKPNQFPAGLIACVVQGRTMDIGGAGVRMPAGGILRRDD